MQLTEYHIPKNPVICEMNGAVNPSNSEWLTRGASVGSLPLFPPASSWLAPDITTAIINGRKPPQLTARTLMRLTPRLPAGWPEQRKLLGFR
jgi:hypothetical protein